MREIVYIQAGNLSNYTGTHFWNTQETYLAENSADSIYDFDTSFREGLSLTGKPTYCPRLLVFDHKSNFGTLSQSNALIGTPEDENISEDLPAIWNGDVSEYRQNPIPQSAYHTSLETHDEADSADDQESSNEDVRYWSDINRVYYIPRTIQKIPDPAEWENIEGDWNHNQNVFARYDEDTALMEGALRLFLEECDSPQGLQIMNDTSSFGGFMHSFLTSFRDEYTKLPCLVAPLLSSGTSQPLIFDNPTGIRKVINDALYLRGLYDLASVAIPIQAPSTWQLRWWNQWLSSNNTNIYHNSAILSSMLETATVPMRLRNDYLSLSSLSGRLNWRGNTPFCELAGIFPFKSAEDFTSRMANLSITRADMYSQFARCDVTRGFTPSGISAYEDWSSRQSLEDTFVSRTHTTSYPLPSSFPAFFHDREVNSTAHVDTPSLPEHCSIFSSLFNGPQTAVLFSSHASLIEKYLKRKPAVETLGHSVEDLQDLVNDMWTLHDNYGGRESDGHEDDETGEDE